MGREDTTVHTSYFPRPIPLRLILLLALAVHGPLLAMQLPLTNSYDANFHVFFASHYAHHWFDPWNPKWFAGFSQTTYPPLAHQWIALLSYVFGLHMAYLLVQLAGVLLIPVGVYRFAQLWVMVDKGASTTDYREGLREALGQIKEQAAELRKMQAQIEEQALQRRPEKGLRSEMP